MGARKELLLRAGLIILVLSLLAIGYYYYADNQRLKKEKQTLEDVKIELQNEIKDLDKKLTDLENVINDQNTQLETKDRKIHELENEIKILQNLVNRYKNEGKLTKTKAEQLQGQLEQKNYYIAKYQQEIARLKEENQMLKQKIETLNYTLQERDSINEALKQDLSLKETKLEAASILKATDFQIYNVNSRGKESTKEYFKSRLLNDIKICFKLQENYVAEIGDRTIYVQIISPSNEILKQFKKNSGYFTHRNREEVYSTKASVYYQRAEVQVCAMFNKPDDLNYEKGQYKIVVFADGYEIGKTTFLVK